MQRTSRKPLGHHYRGHPVFVTVPSGQVVFDQVMRKKNARVKSVAIYRESRQHMVRYSTALMGVVIENDIMFSI